MGPEAGGDPTDRGAPAKPLGICRRVKIRRGIADASRRLMARKILMGNRPQRRRNARIRATFETLYSSGREEGAGALVDLSYRGALLENASFRPDLAAPVRLYVFVRPVDPFELVGSVVRHTSDGFAVEFEKLDPDTQSLVDDVAAIVSVPAARERRDGS